MFDLKIMVKNIKERGIKTKNRFEEAPLIHGQKDRNQLGIRERRFPNQIENFLGPKILSPEWTKQNKIMPGAIMLSEFTLSIELDEFLNVFWMDSQVI